MRDFLENHRCNAICRHLKLPPPLEADARDEETAVARPIPPPTYVPVHAGRSVPRYEPRVAYALLAMATTFKPEVIYEGEEDEDEDDEVYGIEVAPL